MCAVVSQITTVSIVYFTECSGADRRKQQSSASLVFERNSPVTGEFPAQRESNAAIVPIWWRHLTKLNIIRLSTDSSCRVWGHKWAICHLWWYNFYFLLTFLAFIYVVLHITSDFFNDWSCRIAILYEVIYIIILHEGDHDYSLTQCQSNHMKNSVILIY